MKQEFSLILLILSLAVLPASGQEQETDVPAEEEKVIVLTPEELEISDRMDEYFIEMSELTSTIAYVNTPALKQLERKLQALNMKWKTYTEIQQINIAESDYLMENLSRYNILYMSATDSVASQKVRLEAVNSFTDAEEQIQAYIPRYEKLLSDASKLSLVQQTSAQLERLKAGEQLTLASVQEIYEKARQSAELNPALQERMENLEEDYITIQNCSEKIQAAEFKPWITRIKDYVMTLAAVAVIVMFISMVKSKISAAKAARESAKKYKEMLGQNDEYPTI